MKEPRPDNRNNGKPDRPPEDDDDLIPGPPDSLESLAMTPVEEQPKKIEEFKHIEQNDSLFLSVTRRVVRD